MKRISNRQWRAIASVALLAAVAATIRLAMAIAAFTPSTMPTGWIAQDDITNYDLRSGHEVLFRGEYEKVNWTGNLIAYQLNSNGDLTNATQSCPSTTGNSCTVWNGGAAHQLELQGWQNRLIFTMKDDGSGGGIPLEWANLSSAQQTAISSTTILNYLRGDQSLEVSEGGIYRDRGFGAFGDVVHSRPYYLADATNPTVFVGANDGLLHAINSSTGAERWAYMPSMLISKIKNQATYPYVHDYYVDGSINIATISSGAKRILVGQLGAGGRGIYALDITGSSHLAPATESGAAGNVLWEITNTSVNNASSTTYKNLGYTFGVSSIVKVGSNDAVVVGNGYNDAGDYQAYLYVIKAADGSLIRAIQAGTSGTSTSPNGLSTPTVIDTNGDGTADVAYAGDLNGTMWKFDLNAGTATALLVTNPARPITSTPGVAQHPNGGFMVTFGTGSVFTSADMTTTATDSIYGIWDGAPSTNTALLSQTLTERCYTSGTTAIPSPCTSRVRTVTSNQPDWSAYVSGSTQHNKGWKVDLPAGERLVGDGSFIENGRFYMNTYNPNVSTAVPNSTSTIYGENWLMELDYLTGGSKNAPFLDMSANQVIDNDDRVKNTTTLAPVMTTDGVPVGKFLGNGVQSQPVLVELSSLNDTLFNQNPDVTIVPIATGTQVEGVSGGHFDVDIYYGTTSGSFTSPTATLTIGTTGQTSGIPATLGAITVNGTTIVPAMTTQDLPNGAANASNAAMIQSKIGGGFTATVSGNVVTVTAPAGTAYNGATITIGSGTSSTPQAAAIPGVYPTGLIKLSGGPTNTNASISASLSGSHSVGVGSVFVGTAVNLGKNTSATTNTAQQIVNNIGTGGVIKAYVGGNTVTPTCGSQTTSTVCLVNTGTYTNGDAITLGTLNGFAAQTASFVATAGGQAPVPAQGWTDFKPAITASTFNTAGTNPTIVGDSCTTCQSDQHFHQYDDTYNVTGVNFLNPSSSTLDIKLAIPVLNVPFKVLAENQYLSPAATLNIDHPLYTYNLNYGYIPMKTYVTSSTLDLATLQTYQRDPGTVWPGTASTTAQQLAQPKYIGSLAINLPVDGLSSKDWWGNGDVRAGLHPTQTGCVNKSAGTTDGNMYQPVIPPADGTDGPGVLGYSGSTTPATATGVRHNGALVLQLIRDTTPNSAIEMSVPGRPEYGWRVKSAQYANYVLGEWTMFWHHPNGKCYSASGWVKAPPTITDTPSTASAPAGTTDPSIGSLSGNGGSGSSVTISTVTIATSGNTTTTTIAYSDGTQATIVKTANNDGTQTIVTTDRSGTVTTQTVANTAGSLKSGGDERGLQAKTGRISWREVIKP